MMRTTPVIRLMAVPAATVRLARSRPDRAVGVAMRVNRIAIYAVVALSCGKP